MNEIPQSLLDLCKRNNIPFMGWQCNSLPTTPVQIYDRPGYKALMEVDTGKISIYDRRLSALFPIVDTGSNPTVEYLMYLNNWKMNDTGHGFRVAECFAGAV